MSLTAVEVARMLDLSAVQANDDEASVRSTVELAKQYHCHAVFTLPCYVSLVKELLADSPDTIVGAPVSFPSGAATTRTKVFEARELLDLGCRELDLVINVPLLLSNRFGEVETDIRAVVETANGALVKVILECHYLNPDLIRKGCDLSISAGAQYVKTGTGWAPTGATVENVSLIKAHVGNAIKIKAAGGVRGLDILTEMAARGASRFGVSAGSARKIFAQIEQDQ